MWSVEILRILFFSSIAAQADSAVFAGRVVSVNGKVLVQSEAKQTAKSRPLQVGQSVYENDLISTPPEGGVKIFLQDRSILDIGPSSIFHIRQYQANSGPDRAIDLSLPYGAVRASITRKLEGTKGRIRIRTPAATMGVRGTEFVVKAPQSKLDVHSFLRNPDQPVPGFKTQAPTEIVVLQGKVDVGQANALSKNSNTSTTVTLSGGEKIVAASSGQNQSSGPIKLNAAQLNQVSSSAQVEDHTFENAISLESGNTNDPTAPTNLTQSIIAESLAAASTDADPSTSPHDFENGGFVGTNEIDVDSALGFTPVNIPAGGIHRVRVVITR